MVSSNQVLDKAYFDDLYESVDADNGESTTATRFEKSGLARFNTERRFRRSGKSGFTGSHRRSDKKKRF